MKENVEEQEVEVVRNLPAALERSSVLLVPVMSKDTALQRLQEFQEFVGTYLTESEDGGNDGGDYGIIPGTKKKTLLKSGADKLCELYGLYDEYEIKGTIDWASGLFDYEIKCNLKSRRDDSIVGTGVGSCSSFESKYKWRDSQRKCPQCGAEAIIAGKAEYVKADGYGYWLCFAKKGGCNAKFKQGDKAIEGQVIGRVANPDIVDIKNTVLKMAKKRAKIDAIIGATRSSGIFSQDMEELVTPATTPPPPVITEPKTYARKVEPPEPEQPVLVEPPKKKTSSKEPVELIDKVKQDWLRMEFKEMLPVKYQPHADQLRRDFLVTLGFMDDKGVGTSKQIPDVLFKSIAAKCLNHAKTIGLLGTEVPGE